MGIRRDYTDRTFGRITLKEPVPGRPGYWRGKCSCGNPVEKRIDNLTRPGDHSCGQCPIPAHVSSGDLERRIRTLEAVVFGTVAQQTAVITYPDEEVLVTYPEPQLTPKASQYSCVKHDGEFWQATNLAGKVIFWADTEQEAALAARVYLESMYSTCNRRVITDEELSLDQDRRDQIRHEVITAL